MQRLLAQGVSASESHGALIDDPAGLLAVLLAALAGIFWLTQRPTIGKLFKVVPALVFCYFVPTTLATLGVIPHESALYGWVKTHVLPASLLLLILALDLPALIRLGPKAGIMLLAGTTGVVIGGPIALLIANRILPDAWALDPEIWRGLAALSGSWIGGGANFVAIGQAAEVSDPMLAAMVVPDVFVASLWMGTLLYLAGMQERIDRFTGADASAIDDLKRRMIDFQERVTRVPSMPDLLAILALGFLGSWVALQSGIWIENVIDGFTGQGATGFAKLIHDSVGEIGASTWKLIVVTTVGVLLSFTAVKNLEGAGASKVGSVMIYLLVACIGASANFSEVAKQPGLIVTAMIWMAVHIIVLLTVAKIIKAPIFFVAVGSQSNIGGAASAPVVAAAFHPSLAAVGAILAVAGYVLGTYCGLLCMKLLKWASGVD